VPSSSLPLADLGPELFGLLLRSILYFVVAGLIVGVATWILGRRNKAMRQRAWGTLLGPVVGEPELPARKYLRISLGLLWIVDGLLQAQPDMPAGFVRDVITPGMASSPSWLATLINPLAEVWTKHPVVADATTVWIQVGLGLLILVGGHGVVSKAVLWASVGWSLFVWIMGEFLGGILSPGASWLVGAPGGVLIYGIAAALLLAPWSWWGTGRCSMLARRSVAAWFLIGAALQALPWEGSWSSSGLSNVFADGAGLAQPTFLRQPIVWMTTLSQTHPTAVNAVLVALLVSIGVGLWASQQLVIACSGLVLCAVTWWLAQDFGVLGGVGTDPNAALPLALLIGCSMSRWQVVTVRRPAVNVTTTGGPRLRELREPALAGVTALGLGAVLIAPLTVIGVLVGPAGASAVVADSGGGVLSVPNRAAPQFALTDQDNKAVTSEDLRGKLTLLTFLDPVCSDDCPVIANQLAIADRELGPLSSRIEIVAIDSNPLFHHVSDVAAFTASHGLANLPNWHFLAGSQNTLQNLAASYGVAVQVPTVGMIEHGEGIYFLAQNGREEAYLDDGAGVSLTTSYAQTVRDEVRRLLRE
jgi:cytochrome oxidase Cu insertion factor (SCO1/SenC/PrrC family)